MDSFADGLNYYLYTHPAVKPEVITRFEPWMALTFSEGQHRRRHRIGVAAAAGGAVRQGRDRARRARRRDGARRWPGSTRTLPYASRRARTASPSPPSNTTARPFAAADQPAHVVLLPRRAADGERGRPQRIRCVHLGTVLHLPGIQQQARMDAHLGRRRRDRRVQGIRGARRPTAIYYKYGTTQRKMRERRITLPYKAADGTMASRSRHRLLQPSRPDRAAGRRPVDRRQADERADEGADAVLRAHEGHRLRGVQQGHGPAHELVEQHGLCRCRRQHRLLARQLRAAARPEVRLVAAGGRQRPGHRVEGPAPGERNDHAVQSEHGMDPEHQQHAVHRVGSGQSAQGQLSVLHGAESRELRAASMPCACSRTARTSRSTS